METVKFNAASPHVPLLMAEQIIRAGGVVVCPTDTVYGLIADATNKAAVEKIFAIKKWPREKALPIFVKDIAMARQCAYISDVKARFLEKIWPGPVTALFHHKEKLPYLLTAGSDMIGMRVPDHAFLRKLLEKMNIPLVQTSANISGMPPLLAPEDIEHIFSKGEIRPDIFIDHGIFTGTVSTVVNCTRTSPLIVRSGMMTKKELDELIA